MPRAGAYDLVKEKYWREIIAAWRSGGLSQAQFCRNQGIKRDHLSNWTRRLDARDAKRKPVQPALRRARKRGSTNRPDSQKIDVPNTATENAHTSFVQVNVRNEQENTGNTSDISEAIEVLCPSGVLIKLPPTMEARRLLAVLGALAGVAANVL